MAEGFGTGSPGVQLCTAGPKDMAVCMVHECSEPHSLVWNKSKQQ